jgi:hypothetical protein
MTENSMVPFYRCYLLNGKTIYLDKSSELSDSELKHAQHGRTLAFALLRIRLGTDYLRC